MHLSKRIFVSSPILFRPTLFYSLTFCKNLTVKDKNIHQSSVIENHKFWYSTNKNTVSRNRSSEKPNVLTKIQRQIDDLTDKTSEKQEIQEMKKIIYPEALLHGKQNISKLSKLYDEMIERLEGQNLQHRHFQQLINAGDFYHKMEVRRLKALKPYLMAKHHIEAQNLDNTPEIKKAYQELCQKINKLIEEDINKGQCRQVERYYKEGLQQEKTGNQLESLYYYHKGICISEYDQIPDKLVHFNLLAHYTFLSELMRPKSPNETQIEHCNDSIKKYQELQKLGRKWAKLDISLTKDQDKMHRFEQTQIWVHSNKGDIYFKAKRYEEAIKCYQKVINYYKKSKYADQRLKIIRIVDHMEKSYEKLGMTSRAIDFLQWAHDFIKKQISQNMILKSKYLKPIDEMLMQLYQKCTGKKSLNSQRIQQQLRQIVQG